MKKAMGIILVSFSLFSLVFNIFFLHSSREFSLINFQPKVKLPYYSYIENLPAKTFTYLGHGKQSIVFESPDHKYVIKLFYWKRPLHKKWYCHLENWLRLSSPSWIYKLMIKKSELRNLLERTFLASHELHEETGIIALHLKKKEPLLCQLIDRGGKSHHVDLRDTPFVLQKKAILTREWLDQKIASGDIQGAKEGIQALRELLKARIKKGFIDKRQVFKKNYGFIDEKPVQIDIGKIERKENLNLDKQVEKVSKSLDKFLRKRYPEFALEIKAQSHIQSVEHQIPQIGDKNPRIVST